MQIHSASFQVSSPDLESCPDSEFAEFAFIGRSNVGKSSLINTLTRQKKALADVSKTPGRTQLINFYLINKEWHLVDLPGYGYAKVSGKKIQEIHNAVSDYLLGRSNLVVVFLLIDIRVSPQENDLSFARWLTEMKIPFVLVFTKVDKLKPNAAKRNADIFINTLQENAEVNPRYFFTSSQKQDGRKEILSFIQETLKAS